MGRIFKRRGSSRPHSTAFDKRTGPTRGENLLQNTKFFGQRRQVSPSLFFARSRPKVSHKRPGNFSVQGVIHSFHTVFNSPLALHGQETWRFPQASIISPAGFAQVRPYPEIYITSKYTSIHGFPRFPARKLPGTCKRKKGEHPLPLTAPDLRRRSGSYPPGSRQDIRSKPARRSWLRCLHRAPAAAGTAAGR